MTIYATARTMQHYQLKTPDKLSPANVPLGKTILERDARDELCQWSMDLFKVFDKDCLAIVNRASKLTLFLFDVRKEHLDNIGNIVAHYMFELYSGDQEMTRCLLRMFNDDKYVVFSLLKKRCLSASLNHMIVDYSASGDRFRGYIDYRGVLHIRQFNYDVNFNYFLKRMENGTEIEYAPGRYFRELVTSRYCDKQSAEV